MWGALDGNLLPECSKAPPFDSISAEPLCGGVRGEKNQLHGRSAAAPVPTAVPPRGADWGGKARRLFTRVAEPTGGRNVAWQPSSARGQSSGDAASAAALTGPRAAAQTGVPFVAVSGASHCGLPQRSTSG